MNEIIRMLLANGFRLAEHETVLPDDADRIYRKIVTGERIYLYRVDLVADLTVDRLLIEKAGSGPSARRAAYHRNEADRAAFEAHGGAE